MGRRKIEFVVRPLVGSLSRPWLRTEITNLRLQAELRTDGEKEQ